MHEILKLTYRFGITIIIVVFCCCLTMAQSPSGKPISDKDEKKPLKPGNAWTLSYPLGAHEVSTLDTLLYNYQRQSIPSMQTDAYATTGNLGAPGIDMIFFNRKPYSTFFFDNAIDRWIPSFSGEKFYNVYIPTTILSYNFAGNKQNHQDRLNAQFAGNVNRKIGLGAFMDYLYSKGVYENQAVKNLSFGFQGYYTGDRYEMQAFFNHFNSVNKENGGITDDLYITDPAELQGGVDKIEAKSIPTRLSNAHSRLIGTQFYMSHAYKVGFWKDNPDANPQDSVNLEIYVPVTKFIYSMQYEDGHHLFHNDNQSQAKDFWQNFYLNPSSTSDETRYWTLTNTVGISMIEGFQRWAKFGLSAYASYQIRRFTQDTYYEQPELSDDETASLTPLPQGFNIAPRNTQNLLWVGGRLAKEQGSILHYRANARFGLVGDVAGDVEIDGNISTRFRMLKDTVHIGAYANFYNKAPSYLLNHYISNHFAWNNNFGKTRNLRIGGELFIPWSNTLLKAGVENIQNLIYFNQESLPAQYDGNIQVFSATLQQNLKFGIWNWNNTVTYQVSSENTVLPLPKLAIYSNMFLGFTAFRVLHLQIGVDCDYYTGYKGYDYQPATMTFHLQDPEKAITVGNYPYCNVYATAKLYKVRFYVLWSHFNQGLFGKNYFSLPHYPLNPRRLQLGLSIDFAN